MGKSFPECRMCVGKCEESLSRNLGKKIKEKVRELKNDICYDIDDGDLDLQFWKVNISNSDVDKFSSLRLQNDEKKIKELTENLENIHFSFEEGMDNFGRLSEMLTTLKKNKSRAENSILQLAYMAEEWAYIEYENEYFTSITKFIKEKENITYPPVPEQRDLFAIGNRSYQDIRRILGSKEGVNNKMFQNKTDILPYLKETENTHIFETPLFIEIRSVRNYDNRKYSCQLDIVPYLCLIKIT
ncbi:unnamed protein product [Rhizophagus irregularis]|uniref:Uncharacterized protein n=1 Tax=Rhizophagus irregularis TaxID=588596 RepID=A0A916EJ73_9GLOM|nr:unnamed protein product [Rhizophagus irregularis]CAB5188845.1 unnamed protein product [Rhizophagus irregularis]CAB5392682.1 unnamed protein product [Rhizophagus irregularis]